MKQAVLLALPGTSSKETGHTFAGIGELFDRRFPDVQRAWAYTSSGVRRKLVQSGAPVPDPAEALATLRSEGVTHVAVKSLHLATGMEYTELRDLVREIRAQPGYFEGLALSTPLLEAPDVERTVRCLLADLPTGTGEDEALLLAAHGSRHREAQVTYEATAALCRRLDRRVLFGTLMSRPGLEDVMRECKAAGVTRVILAPLMIVAGFSARNELAGEDPASWASVLKRDGIQCTPLIRGLGDRDDIVRIWMDDVERILKELS